MGLERIRRVARGLEPADLVLAGGRHLNVFSGEILEGDVAVADGTIAGIGAYPAKAGRRIDLKGDILPLDVYFMASSCVPATRFETAGGRVAAAGIRRALGRPRVLGVAEMMDVPGVLAGDPGGR